MVLIIYQFFTIMCSLPCSVVEGSVVWSQLFIATSFLRDPLLKFCLRPPIWNIHHCVYEWCFHRVLTSTSFAPNSATIHYTLQCVQLCTYKIAAFNEPRFRDVIKRSTVIRGEVRKANYEWLMAAISRLCNTILCKTFHRFISKQQSAEYNGCEIHWLHKLHKSFKIDKIFRFIFQVKSHFITKCLLAAWKIFCEKSKIFVVIWWILQNMVKTLSRGQQHLFAK